MLYFICCGVSVLYELMTAFDVTYHAPEIYVSRTHAHTHTHTHARTQVGVVMGAPFNSGILTTSMANNDFAGAQFSYQPATSPVLERARAIAAVCTAHGVSLTAAALQFPLGAAVPPPPI